MFLVNGYVFSRTIYENANVRVSWVNHFQPTASFTVNGFNTISHLRVSTTVSGTTDSMMSTNYDYPLRVEIFFDSLNVLPLYNSDELADITDPYEKKRI